MTESTELLSKKTYLERFKGDYKNNNRFLKFIPFVDALTSLAFINSILYFWILATIQNTGIEFKYLKVSTLIFSFIISVIILIWFTQNNRNIAKSLFIDFFSDNKTSLVLIFKTILFSAIAMFLSYQGVKELVNLSTKQDLIKIAYTQDKEDITKYYKIQLTEIQNQYIKDKKFIQSQFVELNKMVAANNNYEFPAHRKNRTNLTIQLSVLNKTFQSEKKTIKTELTTKLNNLKIHSTKNIIKIQNSENSQKYKFCILAILINISMLISSWFYAYFHYKIVKEQNLKMLVGIGNEKNQNDTIPVFDLQKFQNANDGDFINSDESFIKLIILHRNKDEIKIGIVRICKILGIGVSKYYKLERQIKEENKLHIAS